MPDILKPTFEETMIASASRMAARIRRSARLAQYIRDAKAAERDADIIEPEEEDEDEDTEN